MKRPAFGEPRDLWERDGSFRDVYVFAATASDWNVLFALARKYGHRYTYEGSEKPLPEASSIFAKRDGSHLLQIFVGRSFANCHFFLPSEIELDLDPREINDAQDHTNVLLFLEQLSEGTSKAVLVTAENAEDVPYLRYEPHSREWTVYESGARTNDA